MDTSQLTRDLHTHKPQTRMIMSWTDESRRKHAKLLNMNDPKASQLLLRTARWASYHGIEIVLRPA